MAEKKNITSETFSALITFHSRAAAAVEVSLRSVVGRARHILRRRYEFFGVSLPALTVLLLLRRSSKQYTN